MIELTMVLGNIILMNWYYQVKVKMDMKYFWKQISMLMPCVIVTVLLSLGLSKIILFL